MKAATQRRLRKLHFYLGVFFAPMILIFAFSGAFQTFRLNEAKGYGGTPPRWMVVLAGVHKDQALPRAEKAGDDHGDHDDHASTPAKVRAGPSDHDEAGKPAFALKVFTGLMAIGLMFSTLLGIVIGLNNRSMRSGAIVMLVSGTLIPLWMLLG